MFVTEYLVLYYSFLDICQVENFSFIEVECPDKVAIKVNIEGVFRWILMLLKAKLVLIKLTPSNGWWSRTKILQKILQIVFL